VRECIDDVAVLDFQLQLFRSRDGFDSAGVPLRYTPAALSMTSPCFGCTEKAAMGHTIFLTTLRYRRITPVILRIPFRFCA